jgi:hypothetical protein
MAEDTALCSSASCGHQRVGNGEAAVGAPDDAVEVDILVLNAADVVDCIRG